MIKIIRKLWNILTAERVVLFCFFCLFLLLLARDPFSERTLIPNLEPYPDSFHYLVPATSFVSGNGFGITRGFGILKPSVPPLYSFILIPMYLLNNDVRMFYFSNIILSFATLGLFYLILRRVSQNRWLIYLGLLLFTTNYYLYWYPQWAMAENLLLPIFLASLYIVLSKVRLKTIILASLIAVGMYITKYAAAPIGLMFIIIFIFKIFLDRKGLKNFAIFLILLGVFGIPILLLIYQNTGTNHIKGFIDIVFKILPGIFSTQESISKGTSEWMSSYFLINNFPRYLKATLGEGERFLWEFIPIFPKYIAILGYLGLFIGAFIKKNRLFSLSLLGLLFVQMFFVSTFYAVDLRYLFNVIPTLILGIVILFGFIEKQSQRLKLSKIFPLVIIGILMFYSATNIMRIKNQIVLNLKYAEVPWYYKSVLELNNFFSDNYLANHPEKPVVISSIPPYLIDYYTNNNYEVLPLSLSQEFRNNREWVWGEGDYTNLFNMYDAYLKRGRSLYVSTYGLGNDGGLHASFKQIENNYNLSEVHNSCFTQCKIFSMDSK